MGYRMYITEALVCGSTAVRTSDKSYLLFTRELGMIYATAQSVREERSKQRSALQEFSHVRMSLVHGKGGWRIAGTEALGNLYAYEDTREGRTLLRNIFLLLRRTIKGEEAHQDLFDDIVTTLKGNTVLAKCDIDTILSLRILHTLGYIAPEECIQNILCARFVSDISIPLTESEQNYTQKLIENALRESHL